MAKRPPLSKVVDDAINEVKGVYHSALKKLEKGYTTTEENSAAQAIRALNPRINDWERDGYYLRTSATEKSLEKWLAAGRLFREGILAIARGARTDREGNIEKTFSSTSRDIRRFGSRTDSILDKALLLSLVGGSIYLIWKVGNFREG